MDSGIQKQIREIQRLISTSGSTTMERLEKLTQSLFLDCQKSGNAEGIAYALYAQGMIALKKMDTKLALDKLEEARKHAVLSGERETEVRATSGIGLCLMFQQNYEEALEQFLDYMRLYYEYNVGTKYYAALNNVGEIFRLLGKYETALQYYLEAQEVCQADDYEFLWVLKTNIANTHIRLGDVDQARRYLQEARAIGKIPEGTHYAILMCQCQGHLAHLEGNLAQAENLLKEALSFYQKQPYFAYIMEQNASYEDLYEIYKKQGNWEAGENLLLEAIQYTHDHDLLPLHIQYIGMLAKHYEESHEMTKAYDALRKFYHGQLQYEEVRRARKVRNIELRIELDQLRKEKTELHSISHMDRLTGIYNRRAMREHFDQFARGELATESQKVAGMLFDVDYFKEYNDLYGHLEGDTCLRTLAELLQQLADEYGGKAYRYGGDEFLLMLEELPVETFHQIADDLPNQVRDLQIIHERSYVSDCVSCSVGMLIAERLVFENFEQAFMRLDEALYIAKRKGRNRVELMNV